MKNYLVIQAARFGDLVQSKRLILTLSRSGAVHLLLDRSLSGLARVLYPDAEIHGIYFHGQPAASKNDHNKKIFDHLSSIAFERVFNLNFSSLTQQVCRLFDSGLVIGYRPGFGAGHGVLRSPWVRMAFRLGKHRKLTPLNLVDFWAYFAHKPVSPIEVNPAASGRGGGIGVAVAGREQRRSIPAAFLAKLVETIVRLRDGPRIFLLGTENEKAFSARLMRLLPPAVRQKSTDLCGRTGWQELTEIVSSLDALISPDTGTMHLAAHLGVPAYAFFFSSAWCHETGPYGVGHHAWQINCDCSPCLESAVCSRKKLCHKELMSDELLQSFAQAVSKNKMGSLPASSCVQCWASGLDEFGALYMLAQGTDPHAQARSAIRKMLEAYQGLNTAATPASIEEISRMWPVLHEELDWILPPRRYC